MLIKLLLLGGLCCGADGFIPYSLNGDLGQNFIAKFLKPYTITHPSFTQPLKLRLSNYEADEDESLYFIIGEVLYDIVGSQLEFEGDGKFVYHNSAGSLIISDEFHWKIIHDLDDHVNKVLPEISPKMVPEQKSLLKAALKEVSKQDLKLVVEEFIIFNSTGL